MDDEGSLMFPPLCVFGAPQRQKILAWIKEEVNHDEDSQEGPLCFHGNTSFHSVRLLSWKDKSADFQRSYTSVVLNTDARMNLERQHVINWCKQLSRFEVIKMYDSPGSVLDAVSMCVWGVPDKSGVLQTMLHTCFDADSHSLRSRWWNQTLVDLQAADPSSPFVHKEWCKVVKSLGTDPGLQDLSHRSHDKIPSLQESVHIYALANILRRPILVLSESGNSHSSHITGIYLPLEWEASRCCRTPVIVVFYGGQFSPLVSSPLFHTCSSLGVASLPSTSYFPLVTSDLCSLPVRFLLKREENEASALLQDYCEVTEEVVNLGRDGNAVVPVVALHPWPLPPPLDLVLSHFLSCEKINLAPQNARSVVGVTSLPSSARGVVEVTKLVSPPNQTQQTFNLPPTPPTEDEMTSPEYSPPSLLYIRDNGDITTTNLSFGMSLSDLDATLPPSQQAVSCEASVTKEAATRQGIGEIPPQSSKDKNECNDVSGKRKAHAAGQENSQIVKPSAPSASVLPSLVISMMPELCANQCGSHCSQHTYPLCHSCRHLVEQFGLAESKTELKEREAIEGGFGEKETKRVRKPGVKLGIAGLMRGVGDLVGQVTRMSVLDEESYSPCVGHACEEKMNDDQFQGDSFMDISKFEAEDTNQLSRTNDATAKPIAFSETPVGKTAPPKKPKRKIRSMKRTPKEVNKSCMMLGCTNIGDPDKTFMCSTCYTLWQRRYKKVQRQYSMSEGNASQRVKVKGAHTADLGPDFARPFDSGVSIPSDDFGQSCEAVQGHHMSADLHACLEVSCRNYGNPAKGGYCNSCYFEKQA